MDINFLFCLVAILGFIISFFLNNEKWMIWFGIWAIIFTINSVVEEILKVIDKLNI
jgi:hypothetical protein